MWLRRLKNKFFRATIFCLFSTIFIVNIFPYENLAGVLGVLFFTCALFVLFKNEKLIDLAHSKKYRFSFIRQLFNLESFAFYILPKKFKNLSIHFTIFIVVLLFSIFTGEWLYLLVFAPLILILNFLYR